MKKRKREKIVRGERERKNSESEKKREASLSF